MILDEHGEKWACENCVKGHRVSSCQHKERPLQHINKKGRPVSQCPHCRGLRKNRASHVKCECGGHPPSKEGSIDKSSPSSGNCGCMSGMRCTCSIKKEVPDFQGLQKLPKPTTNHRRTRSKPEAQSNKHESAMPKFLHSLNPSLAKLNNAAQDYGQPYPQQRHWSTSSHPYRHAQRSVDSLPLMHNHATPQSPFDSQFLNLPMAMNSTSSIPSEQGSPYLSAQTTPMDYGHLVPSFDVSSPGHLPWRNYALSQGNPARYSVHDLSYFSSEVGSRHFTETPQSADREIFNWNEYDMNGNGGNAMHNALASSEVDYTQPDLSRSSTGTLSEAGDHHMRQSSVSSAGYNSGPHPTITIDSSRVTPAFSDSPQDAYSVASASSYVDTPSDFVFPPNASSPYISGEFSNFGPVDHSIQGKDFAAAFDQPDVIDYSPVHHIDTTSMPQFSQSTYWTMPAIHDSPNPIYTDSPANSDGHFEPQMSYTSWTHPSN